MAIDYTGSAFLLSARRRGIPLGRVLTLGRQHLSLTGDMIAALERQFEVDLGEFSGCEGEERFAEPFLEFLGATSVTSMDFSDYEESSLCHDLNRPIPEEWKGGYDSVIDGGTLEHVFDFPCAIRNAMELLDVGGHFFGFNPADHWLGHGFYQFGPELFFRVFTAANGFEVVDVILAEDSVDGAVYKVRDPASTGHRLSIRSRERVTSLVLARRTGGAEALFGETPQQSDYTHRWESGEEQEPRHDGRASGIKSLVKRILPGRVVRAVQRRAIERRHAQESSRGLTKLRSLSELE